MTSLAKLVLSSLVMTGAKLNSVCAVTIALLVTSVALTVTTAPAVPPAGRQLNRAPGRGADARSEARPRAPHAYPLPAHAKSRLGTLEYLGDSGLHQVIHSHDGKLLITSDDLGFASAWDAASGQRFRKFALDSGDIALAPNATTVAAFDHENRLRLWDLASGIERRRLTMNGIRR